MMPAPKTWGEGEGDVHTYASNVIERINEARRIIAESDFSKDGTVGSGRNSYKFIPIAQILDAVRKAHAAAGVTVVFGRPEYTTEAFEKRYTYTKETTYNGDVSKTTWHVAVGHIHATIYGSSVEDCIEFDVPFEAQDNSDKLTNKIITNAERCLYRVLYAIDEGEGTDPEAYNEPMEAEPTKDRREFTERASADPFFGKKNKQQKAESKGDDSVLLDRPIETIRASLMTYIMDVELSDIINPARSAWGSVPKWTDDQCRQIYARCVRAKQAKEAVE